MQLQCNTTQLNANTTQHNAMQCSARQCSVMKCNAHRIGMQLFATTPPYQTHFHGGPITLHYRHFKRHLHHLHHLRHLRHLLDQWCINNYMLYEIQPTGPAHRLATQQVKSGTTKKENQLCSGANCSNTHNTEGHSFKILRFFQVIRLCSHRFTFMLMTWKISSIFSTVTARISFPRWRHMSLTFY